MASKFITLGTIVETGKPAKLDIEIALRTGLLLQANSGGGKSFAARRTIEQIMDATEGRIPIVVIDPEGEFDTLREKYDFLLVGGENADFKADVRTAALFAHWLLKHNASAVINLYDLSKRDRKAWVAAFTQALVDAPKELWHDLLMFVDEIHEFAPELGHGKLGRDDTIASEPLVEYASKGRKRGFMLAGGTQRLSKLRKDLAAELKNVCIGFTFLDNDCKRAIESLGIERSNEREFKKRIKQIEPGTFYMLGRALALDPTLMKFGEVQTTHPEPGRRVKALPPPTAKIKHLLPQLKDLPQEAEKKLKTEAELRAALTKTEQENARLKRENEKMSQNVKIVPQIQIVEKVPDGILQAIAEAERTIGTLGNTLRDAAAAALSTAVNLRGMKGSVERLNGAAQAQIAKTGSAPAGNMAVRHSGTPIPFDAAPRSALIPIRPPVGRVVLDDDCRSVGKGERLILIAIAQHPDGVTREQLTVLTGYKRSTRDAYIQRLRAYGCVDQQGESLIVTDAGATALGSDYEPLPTGAALRDYWLQRLPEGERKCFEVVVHHFPSPVTREEIGTVTEYKRSTRDAYLQRLLSRKLIESGGRGDVRASAGLF